MTPAPPTYDPRTRLAAERTFLAWIRTGISLMGFGFVVARFGLFLHELVSMRTHVAISSHPRLSLGIGVTLVTSGILTQVAAAIQHRRLVQLIESFEGEKPFAGANNSFVLALALAVLGVGLVVYLLALS